MTRLILVRHGQTDKNVWKQLHGANDESRLNAAGIEQIKRTAYRLQEYKPNILYSAKELRAIESAEIISETIAIPLHSINGLQERSWGSFTGKPWEEVKKVIDPMSLDERYDYIPPQGESWRSFEMRLIETIKKIVEENKDKTIVVVSHGGSIRALMPFLLHKPKEESFKYDPDNASISIFDFDGEKFSEVVVNDTTHLG